MPRQERRRRFRGGCDAEKEWEICMRDERFVTRVSELFLGCDFTTRAVKSPPVSPDRPDLAIACHQCKHSHGLACVSLFADVILKEHYVYTLSSVSLDFLAVFVPLTLTPAEHHGR